MAPPNIHRHDYGVEAKEDTMGTIVIGYDGSEPSKHALERAAKLAGGGKVIVVSAAHALVSRAGQTVDPIESEESARHLAEAKTRLAELGVDAVVVEGVGDPAAVITAEAEQTGADLIVVGSNGKNLLERLFEGSVSTGVTRKSKTDVLVVH
jgi:nucleotide-binding universal stress UspA family protein